jgi:ketosteroid isomerase-like protein
MTLNVAFASLKSTARFRDETSAKVIGLPSRPCRRNSNDASSLGAGTGLRGDDLADEAAISNRIADFARAFNAGDVNGVMAAFWDDFVSVESGLPTESGSSALTTWENSLKATFEHYDRNLKIIGDQIKVSGNMAFERGSVDLVLIRKGGGEKVIENHRFLDVWEKRRGQWKLIAVMSNK